LLAYNIQDAVSLHALVVHTHNEKVKMTPFSDSHFLPRPSLPTSPFQPHRDTVDQILRRVYGPRAFTSPAPQCTP
jgi:hypothetical protein